VVQGQGTVSADTFVENSKLFFYFFIFQLLLVRVQFALNQDIGGNEAEKND
jgi:hypothetical protein